MNLGIAVPFDANEFVEGDVPTLINKIYQEAVTSYNNKKKVIQEQIFKVGQNIRTQNPEAQGNIRIPFSDGKRMLAIDVDLNEIIESNGAAAVKNLEKRSVLAFIDNEWKEHLREMDDLRSSVRNAQYEQKDPLLVYKLEGYNLFRSMLDSMNKDILSFLTKIFIPQDNGPQDRQQGREIPQEQNVPTQATKQNLDQGSQQNQEAANKPQSQPVKRQPVVSAGKKYGRNDRVKVLNLRSGETQEMKFKQAESLIISGAYQLVEEE